MKKRVALLVSVCMMMIAFFTTGIFAANSVVPFPGSGDLNGQNPGEGGIRVGEGQFYAQAFNVNQAFTGFKYAAFGADEAETVKYELFHYRTDIAASMKHTAIASGTFEHVSNVLDGEVLFGKDIAAGKYVLVFTASGEGYFSPCIRPATESTGFACSEGMQVEDFGFFTFDVLAGDPAVMVGGLIFKEAADASAYLLMSEEPVNPAPEPETPVNPDPEPEGPDPSDPPKTGDSSAVIVIAAAFATLSAILLKKRREA